MEKDGRAAFRTHFKGLLGANDISLCMYIFIYVMIDLVWYNFWWNKLYNFATLKFAFYSI